MLQLYSLAFLSFCFLRSEGVLIKAVMPPAKLSRTNMSRKGRSSFYRLADLKILKAQCDAAGRGAFTLNFSLIRNQ
ncbi:hypothetical protein [Candidatus Finniella inopinata]|uniref:Uncharacterized protein n=1 Tax=Candidatus Finniella inopinata TaxID=1696036 RepID=A0A4Q7DKB0_9PROT|nr:hypothetical protein [Candidatus Finniella inopinata]RZI46820.1 hypothetical protein EQU50_00925 [Candidatus Finniella inopinata]